MSDYTLDTLAALVILRKAKDDAMYEVGPAYAILDSSYRKLSDELRSFVTKGEGN